MIDFFNCLRNNRWFQAVVIGVILLSAVASGGRTYPLSDTALLLIDQIDYAITLFFVVELLVRFIGEPRKRDFLKNGWNVFDSVIVLISLIPSQPPGVEAARSAGAVLSWPDPELDFLNISFCLLCFFRFP